MITLVNDFKSSVVFNNSVLEARLIGFRDDFENIWLDSEANAADEADATTTLADLLRELEDFIYEARHAGCFELMRGATALQERVRNHPLCQNRHIARAADIHTSRELANLLSQRSAYHPAAVFHC